MDPNITAIIVIIALTWGALYANMKLNPVPMFRVVLQVLIILVGAYYFWQALHVRPHTMHIG